MNYELELKFFQKLLENFHLSNYILSASDEQLPAFDLGLRHLIYAEPDYAKLIHKPLHQAKPNTIYRITDAFLCSYIYFRLPDTEKDSSMLIGPYTHVSLSKQQVYDCSEKLSISPKLLPQLEKYYTDLPTIPDESTLVALVNTFGEVWIIFLWSIWNSLMLLPRILLLLITIIRIRKKHF